MTPSYGQCLPTTRLQSHYEKTAHFTNSVGIPDTSLIDFGRMKDRLDIRAI